MTSEIRTNTITSLAGLSTVTFTDSGPMFSGITTFVDNSTFSVGTGGTIHAPATNVLTFGTNSSERLRIDANGKITHTNFNGVGFTMSGTGDPTFQISDADGTNQYVQLAHNGGDSYIVTRNNTSHGEFLIYSQNGSETLNRFKVHSNGDISCGGAADNNIYNDSSGGG